MLVCGNLISHTKCPIPSRCSAPASPARPGSAVRPGGRAGDAGLSGWLPVRVLTPREVTPHADRLPGAGVPVHPVAALIEFTYYAHRAVEQHQQSSPSICSMVSCGAAKLDLPLWGCPPPTSPTPDVTVPIKYDRAHDLSRATGDACRCSCGARAIGRALLAGPVRRFMPVCDPFSTDHAHYRAKQ